MESPFVLVRALLLPYKIEMFVDRICEACGGSFQRARRDLTNGRGKFCSMACRARHSASKHLHAAGGGSSATYQSWAMMKHRCSNQNSRNYKNYGGRGIGFDPRWGSFETFLAEMGKRPEGKTLDRIDNSLGYWPGNCRWATRREQLRNRRCSVWLTYGDRVWLLSDLATLLGLKPSTLSSRVTRGWPEEMWAAAPNKSNRVP